MYGRLSEGIEARVSSVSLARGRAAGAATATVGGVTDRVAGPMSGLHAVLHDGLSELRMQLAQARAEGVTSLSSAPAFADEARLLVETVRTAATSFAETINKLPEPVSVFDWKQEQAEWDRQYRENLKPQLESWRRQLDVGTIVDADEQKRVQQAALESVCQQIRQRINEANFLPLQALERMDVARQTIEKWLADFAADVQRDLSAGVDRVASRYRSIVDITDSGEAPEDDVVDPTLPFNPALTDLQQDVEALFTSVIASMARIEGDAVKNIIDNVGEWFSVGDTGLIADLTREIRGLVEELRLLATDVFDGVSPIDVEEPDWKGLKRALATLLSEFTITLTSAISDQIDTLRAPISGLLTNGRLTILEEADTNLENACKNFTDAATFLSVAGTVLGGLGGALQTKLEELLKNEWKNIPGPFNKVGDLAANADGWFAALKSALDPSAPLDHVEQLVETAARTITDGLEGAGRQVERAVVDELRNLGNQVSGAGLELTRVLATGPINDAIACTRDRLGYYYDAAKDQLDVTRASAIFNDIGASVLNSLSAELPFDRIRDRLLPQLDGLDLGQLLPNFGGLKLEHLFPDLKAPNDGSDNDWIRIRHGFDKDRLTAFANVDVDKVIEGTPAVFVLPPVSLKLRDAHFLASSRLELSSGGGKSQSTKASIDADWLLCVSERPIVTIRDGSLFYDSDGGFDFDFDSEKVELAPEFQFITQALKSLLPQEEGLTLTPIMPAGIRAELGLPLPDLTTGAFTLTGITLYAVMELTIADGFEVRTGFWLSKPERPFGLAILFLGGGGWVGVEVRYRPPSRFVTRVSIGVSAGAFVAINFGVARGSAGILFTAGVDFYRNSETQGGQALITLGILVWGEFSILGIASASLRMMMSVTYDADNGRMFGTGRVEVSIKICWCFTLRVSQTVRQNFIGKSGGGGNREAPEGPDKFSKAVRTVHSNVAL
jgi:hypothetical protein